MAAFIFDSETNDSKDPEIIEAAWLQLADPASLRVVEMFLMRYRPSRPITLGALATHHIMDEELVDCPPSAEFALPDGCQYLIGHNVDFDWQAAGSPEHIKRICTLALARMIWPQADSHSQSALLYLIDRQNARERLRSAHSAGADVENCHLLLTVIIDQLGGVSSWEELWQHSEAARVPTVMPFGKHKGTPIADVPWDYKQWLSRQPDVDPYLLQALRGEVSA